MAIRKVSYLESGKDELVMPVAPESYTVSSEGTVNTVNITNLGDITFPGYRRATSWTDKFLLPARSYSFNNAGAYTDPRYYIDQLNTWMDGRTLVRYIVSNAGIDIPVYITKVEHGEDDGTNNVKLSVTVTRHFTKTASVGAKKDVKSIVTIKYDRDTMSFGQLCNKYYGEVALATKLLKYNGYKTQAGVKDNASIKIPPRSKLK